MNTANWKWFEIGDLFDVDTGKDLLYFSLEDGEYPVISHKATNNGVTCTTKKLEEYILYDNNKTISLADRGNFFATVQTQPFYIGTRVKALKAKFDSNIYNLLFICVLINNEQYRFSYGRNCCANTELLKIKLPVANNNAPDWQWIEDYMKNIIIPKLPPKARSVWENNFDKGVISNKKLSLNTDNWKWFNLYEDKIFDMFAGKYYPKNSFSTGKTPLVSASQIDNGIMEFTDLEPEFKGNCLTIGKVGMTNFYQPLPFCATADVTVLVPKFEMSKYCALFLKVVLDTEKYRWTYGNQIRLNDSQKITIKLPAKNGQPDWQFMEDYIKSLPYSKAI